MYNAIVGYHVASHKLSTIGIKVASIWFPNADQIILEMKIRTFLFLKKSVAAIMAKSQQFLELN